jgi:hypothetical protein
VEPVASGQRCEREKMERRVAVEGQRQIKRRERAETKIQAGMQAGRHTE